MAANISGSIGVQGGSLYYLNGRIDEVALYPIALSATRVGAHYSAGSGQTAIKYLAAYVYHTALGSQRILSAHNNQLTFKYKDSADQQWRVLQLCATEFLRRFLQHVLPKGFQRVRYFGWLSPAAKSRWQRILALLDWKAPLAQVPPARPPPTCLCCHKPMTLIGHFARPPPPFKR